MIRGWPDRGKIFQTRLLVQVAQNKVLVGREYEKGTKIWLKGTLLGIIMSLILLSFIGSPCTCFPSLLCFPMMFFICPSGLAFSPDFCVWFSSLLLDWLSFPSLPSVYSPLVLASMWVNVRFLKRIGRMTLEISRGKPLLLTGNVHMTDILCNLLLTF